MDCNTEPPDSGDTMDAERLDSSFIVARLDEISRHSNHGEYFPGAVLYTRDSDLSIGIAGDLWLLVLTETEDDFPMRQWYSVGDREAMGSIWCDIGEATECPRRMLIPCERARAAVVEWLRGERPPPSVEWTEEQ